MSRRVCKTREQRLAMPRTAFDADLREVGTYRPTDSGFWAWDAKDGRQGLARTARQAIECCAARGKRD